jgi:hypothetical protein
MFRAGEAVKKPSKRRPSIFTTLNLTSLRKSFVHSANLSLVVPHQTCEVLQERTPKET